VRRADPAICLAALLLAGGCHRLTREEQAAQDARDVARVEAAQDIHPPLQPLRPQPLPATVRRVFNLTEAGCDFVPGEGGRAAPVLVAGRYKAVLGIADKPIVLAADSGSAELASGARAKYAGRTHWAELTRDPGSLIIHDRWDRVVYFARGTLACHG
jgi:hypothetical protein